MFRIAEYNNWQGKEAYLAQAQKYDNIHLHVTTSMKRCHKCFHEDNEYKGMHQSNLG